MIEKTKTLNPACGPLKYNEKLARTLVSEFKSGKKPAFAELWEMTSPFILRILRRGLDKHTASDLAGAVCLALFENGIRDFDPARCSFVTWVYQIALNKKLDELKRFKPLFLEEIRSADSADEADEVSGPDRFEANTRTPLDILIGQEDEALRQKALELLPGLLLELSPDEQFVLYAGIYDNRTDKEISLALDGRPDSGDKYRKIRERALKKLGRMFIKRGIKRI